MAKGKYEEWLHPDGLLLIKGWARDGLTDEQIAKNMNISYSTFKDWKTKYPDISAALKKTKEIADREVENALYKSALGYTVTVKKPIKIRTEKQLKDKGKIVEERIEYVEEDVYIPPSNTAQIFWLKNRKPETWREKREVEDNDPMLLKKAMDLLQGISSVIE